MRNLFIIVLLVGIGYAGYTFYQDKAVQPSETQPVAQPAQPDELSKMAARQHIEKLTQGSQEPIGIDQADHFVTEDQLLKIPAQKQASAGTESVQSSETQSFAVQLNSFGEEKTPASGQVIRSDILPSDNQIRLQELLSDPDNTSGKLFYIHGVTEGDRQGLWGIIQSGLISTFARGIELKEDRIIADIPQTADERLENSSSSFLGSILDRKVQNTYVYNYQKGILGQNPNLITPGQELIIVTFTEAELIEIYNHFAGQ